MEVRELRIGNYLQCKITQESVVIKMIDSQCDVCSLNDGLCDLELLEPIPLTEEWLLKFGFELQLDGSYQKNDFSIFLDKRFNTNLYLQDNEKGSFKWFGYECKVIHVHQLQNLYFALTNEELKIK